MARKKVVNDRGGDVLRTNRLYMCLKTIGEVDEKGKSVFSIGYSGKVIAEPDRPLSTMAWKFVVHIAEMARYSSQADMDADLAELKDLVNSLNWRSTSDVTEESLRRRKG